MTGQCHGACRFLLAWLVAAALPAASAAQTATVAGIGERGGVVFGRVCLDVDGDARCGPGEPGIAGVRVRLDDGHLAVTNAEGRFNALDVAGRVVERDRGGYGAHAASADGLGATRSFELAPGGAASVDLPVAPPERGASLGQVERARRGVPAPAGAGVGWPIAGTAAPGAVIRAGGVEALAGADGAWSLTVPLHGGHNAVEVAIAESSGVSLWALAIDVAIPADGAIRLYPGAPSPLAELRSRAAGASTLVAGRVFPGVALRVGGREARPDAEGRFAALAQADGGAIAVAASTGGTTVEYRLPAGPADGWSGLLLGEAELRAGGGATVLGGRLAASTSGRWRTLRIDAGLDLDDRDRRALAFTSPRQPLAAALVPDPRATFALPGDGAETEDLNAARGRAWARVRGDGVELDVGSARTGVGGGLGSYDRTFFGARAAGEAETGPVRLGGALFGGRTGADALGLATGLPRRDLLAATGGSLFYLRSRNVVVGSEIVRVEWRDPWTGLPAAARELRRGVDYELDAAGGRLLLSRPLASVASAAALPSAEPFAADEAWITVDYLAADVANDPRSLAGGRGSATVGPVTFSGRAATERRPTGEWEVWDGAAALDLGEPLRARLDVARSTGQLHGGAAGQGTSLDGGFTFAPPAVAAGEATAVHASVEGRLGPGKLSAWWRERSAGYSDGAFTETLDARERGAAASGAAGPAALRLEWAERRGADPRDPTGATPLDTARAYGSATVSAGRLALTLDGLHERWRSPIQGEQSAAGLHASWRGAGPLTLEASHMQSIERSGGLTDATFTAAGASVRTREGTLGLRAGWGPELGPRLLLDGSRGDERESLYGRLSVDPISTGGVDGQGSAVGGRQRISGGSLFTEERLVRDPLGVRHGRVAGGSFEIAPGLAVTVSAERGERLRLDGTTAARGAGGVAASFGQGAWRLDGRGELRKEGDGRQWLAGGGGQWEPTRSLTVAARGLLARGDLSGRAARTGEAWLQAAWRSDPASVLLRVARIEDHREAIVDRDATVAGVALGLRLRSVALGLSVDAADQRLGGGSDDRLAGSARAAVEVWGPLDVAAEYARRGSLDGRTLGDLDAVRAEAGLTMGVVRLAVGYTLVGFTGSGIGPEEEDGRFYLRAVAVR